MRGGKDKGYIEVVNVIFQNENGKILISRNKDSEFWSLPGGKKDPDDKDYREALIREVTEEFQNLEFTIVGRFNGEYFGITPNSRRFLIARVFIGRIIGGSVIPDPEMEVAETRWIRIQSGKSNLKIIRCVQVILNDFFRNSKEG